MDRDISLKCTLQFVFAELDRRIGERWMAGNLSYGFWRTGAIPELVPVDTLREYGFWQGKSVLERNLSGQVSVALIGGHSRIGVFLPNRLLEGVSSQGESLTDAVARAHDGQMAPIVRRVGGDTLFDHVFSEAPFSAEWFLRCIRDDDARDILAQHLAWRVIDLWESALRAVLSRQAHGRDVVVRSARPLPSVVTETLPITFQEVYEMQPGTWFTVVSWNVAEIMDMPALEKQLQTLLPDHGITVIEDHIP